MILPYLLKIHKMSRCCLMHFMFMRRLSTAKVNWDKSEALWVGQGISENLPQLPRDLKWKLEGFKILVFFVFFWF